MSRKIYRPANGEGIHPREASRHHIENSSSVLSECLKGSKCFTIKDLDIVSYAAGPGLGPMFTCWSSSCKIFVLFLQNSNLSS